VRASMRLALSKARSPRRRPTGDNCLEQWLVGEDSDNQIFPLDPFSINSLGSPLVVLLVSFAAIWLVDLMHPIDSCAEPVIGRISHH
jgi:hypothetical protein